ncbi:MAG: response regulator [Gammaproteobacteria bacterium]|nr:response regulator [Gammaproteobacteria bacterium]
MADEQDLMSKLARVRQAFGKQLPAKVDELQQLWARVYQAQDDRELLQEFHRQVHTLVGSAGTFGVYSVSDTARLLEQIISQQLNSANEGWDQYRLDQVNQILHSVVQQTRLWQIQSDAGDFKRHRLQDAAAVVDGWNNLLVLVDEDRNQLVLTASILADSGYRTVSFNRFEDVDFASLPQTPGALIVHKTWRGAPSTFVAQMQSLKERCQTDIPLVLISNRDDVELRLAAVLARMGTTRFFATPVNYEKLARSLDGLTRKNVSAPYRVLIVDDDVSVAGYYAAILGGEGISVQICNDPLKAIAQMDRFTPDLVLLDVYMPVCSGLELAAIIRQDDAWAQTPIVFISGETDLGRQLAAMNLGGDDFITKPVDKDHLIAALLARLKRARWVKRLAHELQESLNLSEYQRIALDQHAIVSVTDTDGMITHVNEKFCKVSGYSRDELLGKKHNIIYSGYHDRAFFEDMWQTIIGGKVWRGEICNRAKDGHLYWVDSTIVPFLDDHGKPYQYIAVRTDISHIKSAQNELMQAKENAERANKVKTRFLSSMSHELRTPLNAILGFAQVMDMDQEEPLSESQRDCLSEIHKAGEHLLELINDILDLAKIEDGRVDIQLRPVLVQEFIESGISMITPLLARNHLTLVFDPQQCQDMQVWADEVRLRQALINLLSNACKYNVPNGTVSIECLKNGDGYLRIVVKDTGRGISADKLDNLFMPFNRLGAETSDIEGTGIGLVITKSLVELMGGQVGCDSQLGVGSSFWLDVPSLESGEAWQQGSELSENPVSMFSRGEGVTVLYIEDNAANVRLVSRILGRFPGLALLIAHDGALGLRLAREHCPDVILLDINLPVMDGFAVLRQLRSDETTQKIPVIGVSANASVAAVKAADDARFDDYLTKPFQINRLLQSLQSVLEK